MRSMHSVHFFITPSTSRVLARAVRARPRAQLAADALVLVDQHDAVLGALVAGAGRAHRHAGRRLAVQARAREVQRHRRLRGQLRQAGAGTARRRRFAVVNVQCVVLAGIVGRRGEVRGGDFVAVHAVEPHAARILAVRLLVGQRRRRSRRRSIPCSRPRRRGSRRRCRGRSPGPASSSMAAAARSWLARSMTARSVAARSLQQPQADQEGTPAPSARWAAVPAGSAPIEVAPAAACRSDRSRPSPAAGSGRSRARRTDSRRSDGPSCLFLLRCARRAEVGAIAQRTIVGGTELQRRELRRALCGGLGPGDAHAQVEPRRLAGDRIGVGVIAAWA